MLRTETIQQDLSTSEIVAEMDVDEGRRRITMRQC